MQNSLGLATCEQQLVLRDPLHRFQKVVLQRQAGTPRTHLRRRGEEENVVYTHGYKTTKTHTETPKEAAAETLGTFLQ